MNSSSVQYVGINENYLFLVLSGEKLIREVMEKLGSHNMKIKPITDLI
ncbi:hypothetical protein HCX49_08230 [Sphingobacterium kitahiroshimense]|nr:hypothetical protein [Sphingobacterium sp. B16(2022)]NJI73190.1 hypothetical protein [Sphingobacterium sp. B16(2022)]